MNNPEQQTRSTVALLQQIYGPVHAIALGPVTLMQQGLLSKIQWESVTILDPDAHRIATWRESNAKNKDICVLNRGFAEKAGMVPYFQANIPYESGTTRPETLKCLWQNVGTVEEGKVQASTIEDIAHETGRQFNWLVSEVINAADALMTLGEYAEQIEVVIARTINDSTIGKELPDLSKPRLDSLAKSLGMSEIACLPNRHPKTATIVYARHWKREHDALKKDFDRASFDNTSVLEQKTAQIEGLEAKLNGAQNAAKKAQTTLNSQHKSLQDRDRSIARLKQSIQEKEDQLSQRDDSLGDFQKNYDAILSEMDQVREEKAIAEKKLKIAENNLDDLREKQKALADKNLELSRRLSEIDSHLAAAMTELEEKPNRSTTTRTTRTRTKPSDRQKSSVSSE